MTQTKCLCLFFVRWSFGWSFRLMCWHWMAANTRCHYGELINDLLICTNLCANSANQYHNMIFSRFESIRFNLNNESNPIHVTINKLLCKCSHVALTSRVPCFPAFPHDYRYSLQMLSLTILRLRGAFHGSLGQTSFLRWYEHILRGVVSSLQRIFWKWHIDTWLTFTQDVYCIFIAWCLSVTCFFDIALRAGQSERPPLLPVGMDARMVSLKWHGRPLALHLASCAW